MTSISDLKAKTAITLKEIFSNVSLSDDGEGFEIPFGEYFIRVNFVEISDEEEIKWSNDHGMPLTWINMSAITVEEITPSKEFYEYLAVEVPNIANSQVYVRPQPNKPECVYVTFFSRIAGDSADPNEIKFCVVNLMWDARNAGEKLIERFGAKWIMGQE